MNTVLTAGTCNMFRFYIHGIECRILDNLPGYQTCHPETEQKQSGAQSVHTNEHSFLLLRGVAVA